MCEKGQGQGRRWIFGIGDRRDSHLSNHSRLYSHTCMDIHTHFNGFHFVWPNMSHPRTHRIPLNGINELEANTLAISVFDDLDISNQYRGGFPGQTMMLRSWAHTQFRIYVDLLQEKIHLSSMMFGPHDTRATKAVSIVMLSVSRCSDWILHLMPWRRVDQSAGLIIDWSSVIPSNQSRNE